MCKNESKMGEDAMPEPFVKLVELAHELGYRNIKNAPGVIEFDVDDHWHVAINGKRREMKTMNGMPVGWLTVYLEFNGWPAGNLYAQGGWIAAGRLANERSLLAAVDRVRERIANG